MSNISNIRAIQPIQPVYNPFYMKSQSLNTNEDSFNFVFDLYVNGSTQSIRTRLLPRPGESSTIYSPAKILEAYDTFSREDDIVEDVDIGLIKYNVVFGEEYVKYWDFYDNYNAQSINPGYTAGTLFESLTETHNFNVGDKILITQNPGYTYEGYNGLQTIISTPTPYRIIIDLPHVSTPVNGGNAVIFDKTPTYTPFTQSTLYTSFNSYITGSYSLSNDYSTQLNGTISFFQNGVNDVTIVATSSFNVEPNTMYEISFKFTNRLNYYTGTSGETLVRESYFQFDIGGNISDRYYETSDNNGEYKIYFMSGAGTRIKLLATFKNNILNDGRSVKITKFDIKTIYNVSGYAYGGKVPYQDLPTYKYSDLVGWTNLLWQYKPLKILTDINTHIVRRDENETLSYFNCGGLAGQGFEFKNPPSSCLIKTYDKNGNLINTHLTNASYIIPEDLTICSVPSGPSNLNKTELLYDDTQPIITPNVYKYEITLVGGWEMSSEVFPISDTITYIIDDECEQHDLIRFQWKNSYGVADYYTSTGLSRKTLNMDRKMYNRGLNWDYSVGDRGMTVYDIKAFESYVVNTGWIDENLATYLMNLYSSPEVYAIIKGVKYPIVITDNAVEYKSYNNEQIFSHIITFRLANKFNTLR
jgi:hypothetical protein